MRVVNENEEEGEEDWSCLTRPPTFFPKKKRKKPVADVLAAVWWSRHTHTEREVGGRIYVHTAQRYIHTVQFVLAELGEISFFAHAVNLACGRENGIGH